MSRVDEMRAEVPHVGVEEAHEVPGRTRAATSRTLPLPFDRRGGSGRTSATAWTCPPAATRGLGGAVGGAVVDDDDLVDEAAPPPPSCGPHGGDDLTDGRGLLVAGREAHRDGGAGCRRFRVDERGDVGGGDQPCAPGLRGRIVRAGERARGNRLRLRYALIESG